MTRLGALIRTVWNTLIGYALRFGVVGLACYVLDVSVFNLLRSGALGSGLSEPVAASTAAFAVALIASWLGNRYWTFRHHRRADPWREFAEFAAVAVGGFLIGLLCVWVSHYVLGFQTLLADNIARNVVGLVLGTAFRFLLYRYWVYGSGRKGAQGRPSPR